MSTRSPTSVAAPLLLVFTGGTVGTFLRAVLEGRFSVMSGDWPWTTFAINLVGSFGLGMLVSALASRGADEGRRQMVRLGLGTGLLGGFTTYSTFIVEVDRLVRDDAVGLGVGYAVASVVLGIAAAALGMVLGGRNPSPVIDPDNPGTAR